jgi:hypothetical protein
MEHIGCLFGLHRWGAWKDARQGIYKRRRTFAGQVVEEVYDGMWVEQQRRCERCGRLEMRTVDAD